MGANVPVHFHQPRAVMAGLFQASLAIRANQPCFFDLTATSGALGLVFDCAQQRFFFQRLLVFLFECSCRPHDVVDDDAGQEKYCDNQNGKDAEKVVVRATADVAKCPEDEREPKGNKKSASPGGEGQNKAV